MKLPGLSVFFPFLDDAGTIEPLCRRAAAAAREAAERFEIIVIDDGSRPDHARALRELAGALPRVRVVRHERTLGYGAVVRRGLAEASMEFAFYTDGDGQYDPSELALLWRAWDQRGRPDIVNGYKTRRADPLHRRALGRLYAAAARAAFRLPVRDVDCDFRLMRASLVKALTLRCDGGGIGLELVHRAKRRGASFAEVAVSHYPRRFGRSRFFGPANVALMAAEALRTALLD